MAPNSVSNDTLQRQINKLESTNRALLGLILDLQRVVYMNATGVKVKPETIELLVQNAAILRRLLDGKS
jgi:hypothetical protein